VARVAIPALAIVCLAFSASPALALSAGVVVALTLGNPWLARTRALAHRTLAWSVVGLGAGMNLEVVGRVGAHGLAYTALGIGLAFVLGAGLGRRLGVSHDAGLLVTVGTAICGGSAIAAVAPAIRAKDDDVSLALVSVFLLNAVALVVFPILGHALHLPETSFGLWCALAIHDTSSVVGAAAAYSERALEVATSAKLARALWIVPVTFVLAARRARTDEGERAAPSKRPWFIAGFLASAALTTYVPALQSVAPFVSLAARRLLATTLFLIGLGLTRTALRALGVRPLVHAVALWIAMATATLAAILAGWIT
jgi:uncharacterized integral membrane protein (TIGR00698 family)